MQIRKNRSKGQKSTDNLIPASPLIVLEGSGKVVLHDCRRILCYTPKELLLDCKKERVCIAGKDLYCASFSCGTISVRGKIDSVSFAPREEA